LAISICDIKTTNVKVSDETFNNPKLTHFHRFQNEYLLNCVIFHLFLSLQKLKTIFQTMSIA